MTWWQLWLFLGVVVISLYLLGLVLWRLTLSMKSLQAELNRTAELVSELEQTRVVEVAEATAATAEDLVRLTRLRINQKRRKALRHEQRQRRLMEHLKNAEETP
jgi:biopolymer transport protein ExbB/TolQ